jgi:hypothetical protein
VVEHSAAAAVPLTSSDDALSVSDMPATLGNYDQPGSDAAGQVTSSPALSLDDTNEVRGCIALRCSGSHDRPASV